MFENRKEIVADLISEFQLMQKPGIKAGFSYLYLSRLPIDDMIAHIDDCDDLDMGEGWNDLTNNAKIQMIIDTARGQGFRSFWSYCEPTKRGWKKTDDQAAFILITNPELKKMIGRK